MSLRTFCQKCLLSSTYKQVLVSTCVGFKSQYSIDKIYPNSNADFLREVYLFFFHSHWLSTGTCFEHSKNICPSSSLFQGIYLPFSPSQLRLNIFCLFVILSLTQLNCYTPEIFLFSTGTFKYIPCMYLAAPPEMNWTWNIRRTSLSLLFSHWNNLNNPVVILRSRWLISWKCEPWHDPKWDVY